MVRYFIFLRETFYTRFYTPWGYQQSIHYTIVFETLVGVSTV